jgi:hypothetical protein
MRLKTEEIITLASENNLEQLERCAASHFKLKANDSYSIMDQLGTLLDTVGRLSIWTYDHTGFPVKAEKLNSKQTTRQFYPSPLQKNGIYSTLQMEAHKNGEKKQDRIIPINRRETGWTGAKQGNWSSVALFMKNVYRLLPQNAVNTGDMLAPLSDYSTEEKSVNTNRDLNVERIANLLTTALEIDEPSCAPLLQHIEKESRAILHNKRNRLNEILNYEA